MIIGNGMIAKAFKKYENSLRTVIFASGVSNSKETDEKNFNRERELLNNTLNRNSDKLFVYFSTCSIEDSSQQNSKYIIHKKKMEELIKTKSNSYYIFRLPQVVGKTHSPTLVNFLIDSITNSKFFYVQKNATRNLIDVDDVFIICDHIITNGLYLNSIVNIASPFNLKVIEIVSLIEEILNKKANFELIEQGVSQEINIDKIKFANYIFDKNYIKNILLKRISSI